MSTALVTGARKSKAGGWRIPAGNLEALVIDRLGTLLARPSELLDTVAEQASSRIGTGQLIERAGRMAEEPTTSGRKSPSLRR